MNPFLWTILSILSVSIVSFVGVFFFAFHKNTIDKYLLYLVSFAAGAIMGDAFLHMIPEMIEDTAFFETAAQLILLGIILSFIIEKIIHWHHCHIMPTEEHFHPVGVMSLIGDAVHNVVDGVLIATSFLISVPLGITTTIAVLLHEIPQEISDFALLIFSGFKRSRALLFNFLSALTALLGGLMVFAFQSSIPNVEQYLLPLAAGNFIYIAGADLIPELHRETRIGRTLFQLFCLMLGIAMMFALRALE